MRAFWSTAPAAAGLLAAAFAGAAAPQDFSERRFPQTTGEGVYVGVCQGCHMPDAKGAVGAGAYPALAADPRLQSPAYPALVILKGQGAMPGFAANFSDDQIAEVVNYVRTHFGNHYRDALTAADVKSVRAAVLGR
jgi:mono/diheme cytochrome c family protein